MNRSLKLALGQRYLSLAEPELGLGMIVELEHKTVVVAFPATDEQRRYGLQAAPLKRVQFDVGDQIHSANGYSIIVNEVIQGESGVLVYRGATEDEIIVETEITGSIGFHHPEDKLLNAIADRNSLFQLRYKAFEHKSWLVTNPARGFFGGRLSLIPHQFYIANEVTSRYHPRVLLGDEVGLGKTIEAGLILNKLILSGRVERVLVLTPSSLNFQWYLEMFRKYNLQFSVINEQTEIDPLANPFDSQNLVISSTEFLGNQEWAKDLATNSSWDLLIVDEAHKLQWTPDEISSEYLVVENIASIAKGLLLLTATPELHGLEGHFSHLKLLDPDRYVSLENFLSEAKQQKEYAQKGKEFLKSGFDRNSQEIKDLIDRHGPGRVYFRNERKSIDPNHKLFPHRNLIKHPIDCKKEIWLAEHLKQNSGKKFLLICQSKRQVSRLEKFIKEETTGNNVGVFHEDLSLMARDRQAAYFREENGANILICSEIGSEGRNFQFCQDLILFDLPLNPDLLEQRIGRLDRIGQLSEIYIHVPYEYNSKEELLVQWYEEVYDAFSHPSKGAIKIAAEYQDVLEEWLVNPKKSLVSENFRETIKQAKTAFNKYFQELSEGRDVLVELNSFNSDDAHSILEEIKYVDSRYDILKSFLESAFTEFGVDVEDIDSKGQFVKPGNNMFIPHFPSLPEDGFSYTYDRLTALQREDLVFMSWDHPLVTGLLDLLTGEEFGNATVAVRKNGKVKHCMESFYLVNAIAPKRYEIERFLPPSLLRILLGLDKVDLTTKFSKEMLDEKLEEASPDIIQRSSKFPKEELKAILNMGKQLAKVERDSMLKTAVENVEASFSEEINRLEYLKSLNPAIRQEEIDGLKKQKAEIIEYISASQFDLDFFRFIY